MILQEWKKFKNFKFAQADEVNSGEDRERERRISEEVRRTSVANYSTYSATPFCRRCNLTLSTMGALERHLRRGWCRRPDETGSDLMTGRLFSGVVRIRA